MNQDDFIIAELSDEEVIAIEVCAEMFKTNQDKDLFTYFLTHYSSWFPKLRERSTFVRPAAALWWDSTAITYTQYQDASQIRFKSNSKCPDND